MRACAWLGCRKGDARYGSPRRTRRPGLGKIFRSETNNFPRLEAAMKHWIASAVAILLTCFPGVASAQASCEAIPHGPCAHRLLSWHKSVLSWTIGSCRCPSARAIRRRMVSGNYRNRPSETQVISATIEGQTISARRFGSIVKVGEAFLIKLVGDGHGDLTPNETS
jgi:hypothetical protein